MAGESDLEKKITRYAGDYGCYVRKFTSTHAGVPDRIISKELTLFLEIKDHGKKPTMLQQDEISLICATGGFATWVDSMEDAIIILNGVLANRADWLRKECNTRNYWNL
jgi:hypothetical protein